MVLVELNAEVAAPTIVMDYHRKFRDLRQLEDDNVQKTLLEKSASQGINLGALMSVVLMDRNLSAEEDDVVWDYDLIFQEVKSTFHAQTSV